MESTLRVHFFNHGTKDAPLTASERSERRRCHWCQIRSFKTHDRLPITIVNETDDGATLPPNFRFIDKSVLGPGVEMAEAEFRSGCECDDDEDCMYSSCLCLAEMDDSDEDATSLDGPDGGPRRKIFSYHSRGRKAGLLRSKALQSRKPIYECHAACGCSSSCANRVAERGRMIPLQIFRTHNRGWGVRAMTDIKKGQFVDKYLGEIITSAEADRRRRDSVIAKGKDVYLFALDKFHDPGSLDPRLAAPPLECDGEYMSGPTRFINHSCEPNLRIFARVGDHADKHIHDLALFAIRDISKGEELTFDYVDGLETMEEDAYNPSQMKDMTRCLCGSMTCRGYLW